MPNDAPATGADNATGEDTSTTAETLFDNTPGPKGDEVSRDTPNEADAKTGDKPDEADAAKGGDGADKKSEDGKTDEDKDGAPEAYEDFTVPDGIELDAAAVEAFTPLARELGLDQEGAQKLIDFDSQRQQAAYDAQQKAWDDTLQGWRDEAEADELIGGVNFEENVGVAAKFLDAFGDDALREALEATGTGNHPAFIRAFYKAGKAMGEDTLHPAKGATVPTKSDGETLYPSMGGETK